MQVRPLKLYWLLQVELVDREICQRTVLGKQYVLEVKRIKIKGKR